MLAHSESSSKHVFERKVDSKKGEVVSIIRRKIKDFLSSKRKMI